MESFFSHCIRRNFNCALTIQNTEENLSSLHFQSSLLECGNTNNSLIMKTFTEFSGQSLKETKRSKSVPHLIKIQIFIYLITTINIHGIIEFQKTSIDALNTWESIVKKDE